RARRSQSAGRKRLLRVRRIDVDGVPGDVARHRRSEARQRCPDGGDRPRDRQPWLPASPARRRRRARHEAQAGPRGRNHGGRLGSKEIIMTPWAQIYDPLGHWWLSTIIAPLPIGVLLGTLAVLKMKAHHSALLGLGSALVIAVFVFGMPVKLASMTAVYGAAFGLLPIGWIILNVIFMYQLTSETGRFKTLQDSLT